MADERGDPRRYRIGEFAALTGLTRRAVRLYQARGLLSEPARTASGYRLYDASDLVRAIRIRRLRALGMTLEQIRGLVEDQAGTSAVSDALEVLRDDLRRRAAALSASAETVEALLGMNDGPGWRRLLEAAKRGAPLESEEVDHLLGYSGTVWPHDNAIAASGLARYGFRDEANRIVMAQLEAAAFSDFRLPEAFAGFDRTVGRFPVPYPTACSPQAWATGAPFMFVQTMLGLEAVDGELRIEPRVPEALGRTMIRGLIGFGTTWDIEAIGTRGHMRLAR